MADIAALTALGQGLRSISPKGQKRDFQTWLADTLLACAVGFWKVVAILALCAAMFAIMFVFVTALKVG